MKKKDFIYLGFLLILAMVTHWQWFFQYSILSHSDWMFLFIETAQEQFAFPSLWNATGIGGLNLFASFYPISLLIGTLAKLGADYALIERVVFMWPIALLSVIGSYVLTRHITKSSIGACIGSIVYCYNTYFLQGQTSHLTLMMAYTFVPFVTYFFIRALEEKRILFSIFTSLFLSLSSFYEFRIFYITLWILFFYFVFDFIFFTKKKVHHIFKKMLLAAVPVIITLLLNSYWILGLSSLEALTDNELFNRGLFGNEFANIRQAFALFHPFWTGGELAVFEVQPIPFYFWIIPFAALLGLFYKRKNGYALFFGFISLLGIFLTKQSDTPFPYVYEWLYDNFPGFNAYREASKFFLLIALGYSILIPFFVLHLRSLIKNTYMHWTIIVVIVSLFLWNTRPFIRSEIKTLFVARSIPSDYLIYKNFIQNQQGFFRVLWIPRDSRWSYYDDNKRNISGVEIAESHWGTFSKFKDAAREYRFKQYILRSLEQSFSDNLLDSNSIKYVVVPLQDEENDDNFFTHYGKRSDFINRLEKLPYLKKVDIGTDELIIFENTQFKPHLYISERPEKLSTPLSYSSVPYKSDHHTEYTFLLKNNTFPFYIHFSERYDPNWKLTTTVSNIDIKQVQNDAGLNSYLITSDENRTSEIEFTLFYKPQRYVYMGFIINIVMLGIIIITILYLNSTRRKI